MTEHTTRSRRTFRNNSAIHRNDGLTEIQLTHGKIALVDTFNYPKTIGYGWYAMRMKEGNWYAQAVVKTDGTVSGKTTVTMHKLFLPLIDHRNRDGLDNTMDNLRPATHGQNMFNCKKYKVGAPSRQVGVSFHKRRSLWTASITIDKKYINIGAFKTEHEAIQARLNAERLYSPNFDRYPDLPGFSHQQDGTNKATDITTVQDSHLIEFGVELERDRCLHILTGCAGLTINQIIELIKNPAQSVLATRTVGRLTVG